MAHCFREITFNLLKAISKNMFRYRKWWIVLLLCGLCSCSSGDSLPTTVQNMQTNPAPTPNFIMGNSETRTPGCIYVDQTKIWERGNTPEQLQSRLNETLSISIDGRVMTFDPFLVTFGLTSEYVIDKNNKVIGITGGPMSICINSIQFNKGAHLGAIRFRSTSGKQYEFTWVFEVE